MKNRVLKVVPTRLFPYFVALLLARIIYLKFLNFEIEKNVYTKHYYFFYDHFAPLKFYMYNISLNTTRKLCKNNFCDFNRVKKQHAHTFYFEYVLKKTFEKGYNRVYDPENADLFYIPIYLGAYNMNRNKADLDEIILPVIRSQGIWYDRYGAVDQVFVQLLFSHENIPFTQRHQEIIAAQTTIGDVNWVNSLNKPREIWRYTVMPYNSNFNLTTDIYSKRYIQAFLIGQYNLQTFDKRAKYIRQALVQEMKKTPNTAVIETKRKSHYKAAEFFNIEALMKRSEFCPVPHGDGPASKRMYDTFKTGCIPIVLTDEIRFPFEHLFAYYDDTLIQIPAFTPSYIRYVFAAINNKKKERIRKAQQQLDKLLTVDLNLENEKGSIIWAWMWMQFFKASTVAASKRRTLLKSAYI